MAPSVSAIVEHLLSFKQIASPKTWLLGGKITLLFFLVFLLSGGALLTPFVIASLHGLAIIARLLDLIVDTLNARQVKNQTRRAIERRDGMWLAIVDLVRNCFVSVVCSVTPFVVVGVLLTASSVHRGLMEAEVFSRVRDYLGSFLGFRSAEIDDAHQHKRKLKGERFEVVDEGPIAKRVARGCLLKIPGE